MGTLHPERPSEPGWTLGYIEGASRLTAMHFGATRLFIRCADKPYCHGAQLEPPAAALVLGAGLGYAVYYPYGKLQAAVLDYVDGVFFTSDCTSEMHELCDPVGEQKPH